MRRHRAPDMSISQFRALGFVDRHEGASLSALAEHLGLALPSVSRMLDGLVARGDVARGEHPGDRRRLTLSLTPQGKALLRSARMATHAALAERLATLSRSDRDVVSHAMDVLQQLFGAAGTRQAEMER